MMVLLDVAAVSEWRSVIETLYLPQKAYKPTKYSGEKSIGMIYSLIMCSHETQDMFPLMMVESSVWSVWSLQSWIPLYANPYILTYKNFMKV